jgi:hypothetical protein
MIRNYSKCIRFDLFAILEKCYSDKQFKKETPSEIIGRDDFKEIMKQLNVTDPFLQEIVFNVFDTNKDGSINFQGKRNQQ